MVNVRKLGHLNLPPRYLICYCIASVDLLLYVGIISTLCDD